MIGKSISHFKILEKIGAGGMGEVFLAEDTKLDRKVALKFLPLNLNSDPEFQARFRQEAKAAAALNHPNIVTVHEIGEHEGQTYIAMEHVAGDTLRTRLTAGSLSPDEAVEITRQVCEGLRKAHEADIIHRDLKPENILIDKDGRVRIVDFGLARLGGATRLTRESSTLGTLHYMSPEHFQGLELDHRSDIWAVGVILYEMLEGKVPFEGDYEAAVMYSVLNDEPEPLAQSKTSASEDLQRLVNKALSRDVSARYQSAADLLADLKREKKSSSEFVKPILTNKTRISRKTKLMLASFAIIAVVSLPYFLFLTPAREELPSWLQQNAPLSRITSEAGDERGRISPDGNYLVYRDNDKALKLKYLKTGDVKNIMTGNGLQMTWSPEGAQFVITKFDEVGVSSTLQVCNLLGNITFSMKNSGHVFFPIWSPDGNQLAYIREDGLNWNLVTIKLDGSNEREFPLDLQDSSWGADLTWSPDARKIAFLERNKGPIGSIRILDIETRAISEALQVEGVIPSAVPWWLGGLAWSPDGRYLVYVGLADNNRELFALPMNPKNHSVSGLPIQVTHLGGHGQPFWPTFAGNGTQLSFGIDEENDDIYVMPINIQSATVSGKFTAVATDRRYDGDPCLMPDGEGVVFVSRRDGQSDLYSFRFESNETKRLTHSERVERLPQYSPDGALISFHADNIIWGIPANGGPAKKLTPSLFGPRSSYVWSADGESLFAIIADSSESFSSKLFQIELGQQANHIISINRKLHSWTADISLSPDRHQLAISGVAISADSAEYDRISVLDLETMEMKDLLTQTATVPRSRISWTRDGQFILHDRFASNGNVVIELLPVDGGPPRPVSTAEGNEKGRIFVHQIDPSGKNLLITVRSSEADIWVLGKD